MKTIRLLSLLAVLIALAVPGVALAQDDNNDRTIVGGSFTLASGESLRDLTIIGGDVRLEAGSTVRHVTILGGSLAANGSVQRDIDAYGGSVRLGAEAVVRGDVNVVGGSFNRIEGARVEGQVITGDAPFNFTVPTLPRIVEGDIPWVPYYWNSADTFLTQIWWLFAQAIGLTALAMLVILFAPRLTERVAAASVARPWEAGGLGLLIAILTPPLLIGFAITIIGIPVMLALIVVVGVVLTFGWIAVGLEVGRRLEAALNQHWPNVVDAGVGTFLLALVANAVGLVPCVGWLVPTIVGFLGMGGVILSRFGTRPYPVAPGVAATPA